ncbi:General stress protein 69 [Corynebacterium provencense]|uniref:General stress protein 69 n=1 Tax=Corynebacterium provencense TaxID=1737425 RepID=A0A2Z3YTY8_9CORY|nr:aldo/keto reductase [Corynebacterium provencense]AWT24933.1 General stress protein 69 [Corynebacterium provencense]
MRYTTFGRRTGLRVSEYALGTGNFGTGWGAGADRDEAKAIFDRFVESGGNFIDTADTYQVGQSEQLVGEFIHGSRDDLVLATKFSVGAHSEQGLSRTGNARKNLRTSVEESLVRLDTDYIDVLWVHYPDALTPVDEVLRALDDLVSQGKILYVAFSNFPAWRVSRASLLADVSGWAPVAGIQVEYSLVERTAERELLPMAEALGLGVNLWSPLGGGLLTGKYRQSAEGRLRDWGNLVHTETDARTTAIVDTVIETAEQVDRAPAQVATAWVRERARRLATPGVPIIGPRHVTQLDEYLAALTLDLTDEQYGRLDDVSQIALGVPHQANANSLDGLQGGQGNSFDGPIVPVA